MKKTIITLAAATVLGLTSCQNWLDINTDPNSVSEGNLTCDMIFPGAEMNLAVSYADYLNIVGGYFTQYYAHQAGTSNYVDYSQFKMSATRSDGTYAQLMQRVMPNVKVMQKKAEAISEWGTSLAATTLRAFAYQLLVDCYGEMPYTEAQDVSNLNPKFDDGQVIYEGIIKELDEALEIANPDQKVAKNFTFPDGKADGWIKFANAQKLKMLMRMADVKDVSAEVKKIIDGGNLPTEDIKMEGCWSKEAGHESPFFGEEFSTLGGSTQINVIANIAIIATMLQKDDEGVVIYEDPRLAAFFEPNGSGNFEGNISGTNLSTASDPYKNTTNWCRPVASYDMPVYFITVAEVEFFLAEYYARYGTPAEAKEHYENAIRASFTTAGVDGAEDNIVMNPYDGSNFRKSIGNAKWVALAGINGFEAYTENRRLNYPEFGAIEGKDMYSGSGALKTDGYAPYTLHTPYLVFDQVGSKKMLERFPYPESTVTRNSKCPEFPGYTKPVFWGVK